MAPRSGPHQPPVNSSEWRLALEPSNAQVFEPGNSVPCERFDTSF